MTVKLIEAQMALNAEGAAAMDALAAGDPEPFRTYVRAVSDRVMRRVLSQIREDL